MAIEFDKITKEVTEVYNGKEFIGFIITEGNEALFDHKSISDLEQILSKMKELQSAQNNDNEQ